MATNTTASMTAIATLCNKYIKTQRDVIFQKHLDLLLQRDDTGRLSPNPVTFTATDDTHVAPTR